MPVRGDAVIHRELRAGPEAAQRVHFHVFPEDPQVTIRLAGVIEMLEDVAPGAIQRVSATELDEVNPPRGSHPDAGLGQANQNARDFAQLPAHGQVGHREHTVTVNAARANGNAIVHVRNASRFRVSRLCFLKHAGPVCCRAVNLRGSDVSSLETRMWPTVQAGNRHRVAAVRQGAAILRKAN